MLNKIQTQELKKNGFIRIPDYLTNEDILAMSSTISDMRTNHQTEYNVKNRMAYLSDHTETRVSNAFMISTGDSPLPHLGVDAHPTLKSIAQDYQFLLAQLNGDCVSNTQDTRLLFNLQQYYSGSKPVPYHFDGEYLDYNSLDNDGQIDLKQALVPNYLAVYTLFNENTLATKIKNLVTGEETSIESDAGDLLLLDNTAFLHSVPKLEKPRAMFGFRNFDYNPYFYSQTYSQEAIPTSNPCFSGYVTKVSTSEAQAKLEDFIEGWKENYTPELEAKF